MTESHSNMVAVAQFFKDCCKYCTQAWLVQMAPTLQCPEARGVLPHFQGGATGFCCSLLTLDRLSCVGNPWLAPALLRDLLVAAASSPDQCAGLHTMWKKELGEVWSVLCPSWWTLWCYCCYVLPDAMCTLPYKLLFVLKAGLSHLLLSQEETPGNTKLTWGYCQLLSGSSKGWAVSERTLPGHTHTQTRLESPAKWVATVSARETWHSP